MTISNPRLDLAKPFVVSHGGWRVLNGKRTPYVYTDRLNCLDILKIDTFNAGEHELFINYIRQGVYWYSQRDIYDAIKAKFAEWTASPTDAANEAVMVYLAPIVEKDKSAQPVDNNVTVNTAFHVGLLVERTEREKMNASP